jgi:type II secretory pathway predicted ATPase ExeA/outer membrane protein OmpA-like peptidoglycan-associated protein
MPAYATDNPVQAQLLSHFQLRENPFSVTPDPRFLYLTQTHAEAMASLINGIECGFGFQVMIAQPGMGKTTLLFGLLERFRGKARTAFLFQQQHDGRELLQSVLSELGGKSDETNFVKLYDQINHILEDAAKARERVIVVLDEAQNLSFDVLEALRQLSNFETAHSKLLQIILAGQPQLAKNLMRPEQEQLRQRMSAVARLTPLKLQETRAYLLHRLKTAGYTGTTFFTPRAMDWVWSYSRGIPRNINTLVFNAMLLAYAHKEKVVGERALAEAARDLDLISALAEITNTSGASPNAAAPAQSAVEATDSSIEAFAGDAETQLAASSGGTSEAPSAMGPLSRKLSPLPDAAVTIATPPETKSGPPESSAATGLSSERKKAREVITWPKAFAVACVLLLLAVLLTGKLPVRIPGVNLGQSSATQNGASSVVEAGSSPSDPGSAVAASSSPATNAALNTTAPVASTVSDTSVFFDIDSDTVPGRYRPDLEKVAQALNDNPGWSAIIEGHTDSQGGAAYNLDLSSRRALAVRDELVFTYHVPATRLSIIGAGSETPLQPNETPAGRASNRRVEVRIVKLG